MKYLYTPPIFLQKWFPGFIWHSKVNKVLLTFDDAPNASTSELILKSLDKNSIKGCFFCIGDQIIRNLSLMQDIIQSGNCIGNHSMHHTNLLSLSDKDLIKQISNVNEILLEKFKYHPKYFRPPYGLFNLRTKKIVHTLNMRMMVWSLFTFDYKNDLNIVKFVLEKYLTSNSIVVMHDNDKTKNIVQDEIEILLEVSSNKGFEIGDPAECLN